MSTAAQDARPARRGRGRPRGQDSAVVRERSLHAAIDLIAHQGYAATSMAQVAAAAGISPSGLAHHFPSKPALLGAVLEHRDRLDHMPPAAEGDAPWRLFDALVGLARQNMERAELVLLYASMVGEAVTEDHPAHEWMLSHYAVTAESLIGGLRADQRTGHVRADAPVERIARSMIALMDGLQLQWLLDPEVDMAAALAEHVEDLKRAWGTDPA
ncbi:helix-turn-helix domain-containing protein [Brachybacterium sp.]|uniref:TetR/AcrR family transcriptional regulator n=1 Tax=Brachybacterium sp. TaxID=1891286 RepID=UPI002ED034DC